MTYWNHRVIKTSNDLGTFFGIHEVFYNDDGSIWGYTEHPDVFGEDLVEIRETLEWMQRCLDQPILDAAEIVCSDNTECVKTLKGFDSVDDLENEETE